MSRFFINQVNLEKQQQMDMQYFNKVFYGNYL